MHIYLFNFASRAQQPPSGLPKGAQNEARDRDSAANQAEEEALRPGVEAEPVPEPEPELG